MSKGQRNPKNLYFSRFRSFSTPSSLVPWLSVIVGIRHTEGKLKHLGFNGQLQEYSAGREKLFSTAAVRNFLDV